MENKSSHACRWVSLNVTFLFICDNIYKVRSVLKYLSCWRSPSFIMEIHTLITAVWLDHYWRSYCFFTWIFHQTVYMFNLSCILNINSSNLCILTYCQLWNYYKAGVCLIWSTKTFELNDYVFFFVNPKSKMTATAGQNFIMGSY